MADSKITELTGLGATPASTDILPIVDDPGGTPVTKKVTVANLLGSLDASNIDAGTLTHERGGLEADVSAYTGLLAISAGATSEVDSKAELEAQIADVSDFAMADGDVYTGVHDFGGATSLEIPNGAAPTVDAAGEIAVDTTITDHTGLIKYHDGTEELTVIAVPTANLTTTDDQVLSYDAVNNEFYFNTVSGSGDMLASTYDPAAISEQLVGLTATQTLTNKTIDGDNNTISNLDIGNEVDWAAATDVTDRTAFASGDKMLIFEAGVGMRKIDYDDLPGAGGGLSNIVEDTTPQLGGNLDVNGNSITSATNGDITIAPDGTGKLNLDAGSGTVEITTTAGNANIELSPHGTGVVNIAATSDLSFGGTAILSDSAGTMTLSNVDALDATTATTIATGADNATTTTTGVVEMATAAETSTGTDATRAVTPDALAGSNLGIRYVQAVVFDFTTDTATGDGKFYLHIPAALNGMNLVEVHAEVITAGTTGTTDIQIHNVTDAVDMLSTLLTIDSAETGSDTAATAAVINAANDDVATNDLLRIDVDAVSTTAAKGLIVTLGFQLP